jgi:hypothetical protein
MKLYCPKCAAEIPAVNMNISRLVAKCGQCDSVFSFAGEFGPNHAQTLDAPQPAKVRVVSLGSTFTLQWRWFSWMLIWPTIFAMFWNGIMLFFVGSIFSNTEDPAALFPFLCFPHVWVGLAIAYYVLTGYLNKTLVTLDYDQLTIRHGPMPWWGKKNVATASIVQLYAKENNSRFHFRNPWTGNYELHAILKKGGHIKLLSGLDSSEHALFVERVIENRLRIEDTPVRGEYGR